MSYLNEIQGLAATGNPVSGNPLPAGAVDLSGNIQTVKVGQRAGSASVSVVMTSDLTATDPAPRNSLAQVFTPAPQKLFRTTFSSVIASGVDSTYFSVIQTGTAQTLSQSSGNLVLTSGTTANSETIIRSVQTFSGSLLARIQNILSQRIANNNFYVELVDVIGDSLATTVNSATSITVTIPSNPFTSANVGQSMYVGAVQNISATAVPGRYAIASVSGNNVTFTVAGWPASGSGTCSLFGWNYYQCVFNSTTATNVMYDGQRKGWNSGFTTATCNTTASPGTMIVMGANDGVAFLADQLVASNTTVETSMRASRVVNLADESATLYLQLRSANGSTAPASTTTWTVGVASVENYVPTAVAINDIKSQNLANQMPVAITNTPAFTLSSGTVSTVTACNLAIPGIVADQASGAITTTTTSGTITPSAGISYQVDIPVTAVTGTSPTMDIEIQESSDTGTNWYPVYDFPRITAAGSYTSPLLLLTGNRVRYVQTIGGTTPSFTRAINRLQSSQMVSMTRQIVDRTISLTTSNSSTPTLLVPNCKNFTLTINIGAATSAPTVQLYGSDDNGATFYAMGTALAAVANSTVSTTVSNISTGLIKAEVTVAGTGVTPGYVMVRGF